MYHNGAMTPPDDPSHTALVCLNEPEARSLVLRLADEAGFEVVGAVDKAIDAIDLAAMVHPTVVLLDQELPGMNGLEAIPEIREAEPEAEVLLITRDERLHDEAMRAGAFGVVYKSRLPELSGALRRVTEFIESTPERGPSERRTGKDRRQQQDWSRVTSERRSGEDRRHDDGQQPREGDDRRDLDDP